MTNTKRPDRAEAIGYLDNVRAVVDELVRLYAMPGKTNLDWARISELRTLIKAGHDAAQINAILALEGAVTELVELIRFASGTESSFVDAVRHRLRDGVNV